MSTSRRIQRQGGALLSASLLLCAVASAAQTIDFETVPGGTPSDQLAINTQYASTFGVTFELDVDGDGAADPGSFPRLEAVGSADSGSGFQTATAGGQFDIASPGFETRLGNFFLRYGTAFASPIPAPSLIISYSTPVSVASGEIWDLDGQAAFTEQFLVEALDASSLVLASLLSPLGDRSGAGTLDGKPWTWVITWAQQDIHSVRIRFVGSKNGGLGLGFDNISGVPASFLDIDVDIKPESERNPIKVTGRGLVPVAILGSASFDVGMVDVTTLAFGPDGAAPAHAAGGHFQDVNDDGIVDLVSHYRTQETGLALGEPDACVTGETLGGTPFEGCDTILTLR
jgi:hypothetical protein